MQKQKSEPSLIARVAVIGLVVVLLSITFKDVDMARVRTLLAGVPLVAIALMLTPQLIALCVECLGWQRVFAELSREVSFLPLLTVRISTEALAQTMPLGVVCAESVKPVLLERHCGVPVSVGIAAIAARKYLLILSQAVYVALAGLLGFSMLRGISQHVMGVGGLEWFVLSAATFLAVLASGLRLLLGQGDVAIALFTLLSRIPGRRLQSGLQKIKVRFSETDAVLSRYFRLGLLRSNAPLVHFFTSWLIEAVETYLFLRLLGVELDFTTVAAFEVALSFLRNVVFVVPAGLGVQDLGYIAFLKALGVPDALSIGAAFLLLKRAKEAFWAAVGLGLFVALPRNHSASQALAEIRPILDLKRSSAATLRRGFVQDGAHERHDVSSNTLRRR